MAIHRFGNLALMFLVLGLSATVYGQIDPGNPLESGGSGTYQSAEAKAAKAYRQGMKFRQRAEKAAAAAEREALYKRALEKFYESTGHVENFDARLAMGEVHLALANKPEALKACGIAKFLKPRNDEARVCYEAAGGEAE